jgi:hypothetical protein
MADRKTHEEITLKKFGIKGTEVHKWMDKFFWKLGPYHRYINHHIEGAKECAVKMVELYGGDEDKWFEIAMLHLDIDFQIPFGALPIPHKEDYEGGEGDWPNKEPWIGNCPWKTLKTHY